MVFITQVIKHTFILFLIANFLVINSISQTNIKGKFWNDETRGISKINKTNEVS